MEFKSEQHNLSFSVPDRVTVRQQMAYFSEAARAVNSELFERLWLGARKIITDGKYDKMPDVMTDLDDVDSPDVTAALVWAGLRGKEHIDKLDDIPKNS